MTDRLSTPDASSTTMHEELPPDLSQQASVHQESVDWSSKKIKRRSKKDKTGRNFICGCGKQYLSYPALYTHIKTKHNGVQPMGTKNHLALHSKRGRPKKMEFRNPGDRDSPDEVALTANVSPSLLAQLITDNNLAHKNILEKSDLICLKAYGFQGKTDASVGFPVIFLCNEEKPSFHPFHVIINHFKFSNVLSGYGTKNPSCDTIIALFLYSISRLITDKFYIVIGIFFRNLRECLNEYGYDVISEYFEKNTGLKREDLLQKKKEENIFCEIETCEYLPLIAEKLIIEYLPEKCPNFEPQLAIDTMYDFCNWLHKKRFAKVKVRFGDENANLNANINSTNINVNVLKP